MMTVMGAGREMVLSFRVVPGLPLRGKWLARITECESDPFFTDITTKGRLSTATNLSPSHGMGRGHAVRDVVGSR